MPASRRTAASKSKSQVSIARFDEKTKWTSVYEDGTKVDVIVHKNDPSWICLHLFKAGGGSAHLHFDRQTFSKLKEFLADLDIEGCQ